MTDSSTIPKPANVEFSVVSQVDYLAWDDHGDLGYAYQIRQRGEAWPDTWTTLASTVSEGRRLANIAGLENCVAYELRLRAEKAGFVPSDPSDTVAVTPGLREGTEGDDELVGTEGDDCFNGLGGNDTIYGLGGNDVINGALATTGSSAGTATTRSSAAATIP